MDRIKAHRWEASLSSGGTSAKHIYEAFVNLAKRLDLSGDILDFGAGKGNLITYRILRPQPKKIATEHTEITERFF